MVMGCRGKVGGDGGDRDDEVWGLSRGLWDVGVR